MSLTRLVYMSHPFGFDSSILYGILTVARRNNTRDGITGALICRADIYLQLLEGPEAAIERAYGRIERDDRHLDLRLLLREPATERLFPDWAMRDDPARSWMWTQTQVADGLPEQAGRAEVIGVFRRLLAEAAEPV